MDRIRVAERDGRKACLFNLEYANVHNCVIADYFRVDLFAGAQFNLCACCALNHVRVGNNVAVGGDDKP
ncbi:hypothetical protein SDC9_161296 [bioreactor metagenome]|uniref:Uncharacterized protein n=1 Tax=bioreactor metagenome TaxID=1076179 RepID=A0A645FJ29_9ZZZZ